VVQIAGGIILAFLAIAYLPEIAWLIWNAIKLAFCVAMAAIVIVPILTISGVI